MYTPDTPIHAPAPRIGEWLSESFSLFGREWQTWVIQGLIAMFLGLGPYIIGYVIFFTSMIAVGATSRSQPSDGAVLGALGAGGGALFLGGFVSMVLLLFLMAGMKRTALKQLRGEPIAVGDIFSAGDVVLKMIGSQILVGLLVSLGALACFVPAFIIAGGLCLTLPILVEERIGVTEAMSKSWRVTKPYLWSFVGYYLLVNLILSAGSMVVVGLAVTLPIYTLAMMIAYRDMVGLPGAVPTMAPVPVVPISDVNYGIAGAPVMGGRCPACERPVAAGAVVCPFCHTPLPSASPTPPPGL